MDLEAYGELQGQFAPLYLYNEGVRQWLEQLGCSPGVVRLLERDYGFSDGIDANRTAKQEAESLLREAREMGLV